MTKSRPKIITVTLDPKVWDRGRGLGMGRLLRLNGAARQQCCIGVACSVLGVDDGVLLDNALPDDIDPTYRLPPVIRRLMGATNVVLYDLNDTRAFDVTDEGRVTRINDDLKAKDIPLRFRLKKSRRAIAAKGAGCGAQK